MRQVRNNTLEQINEKKRCDHLKVESFDIRNFVRK